MVYYDFTQRKNFRYPGFWDHFDNKADSLPSAAVAAIATGLLIFPLTKRSTKVVDEATNMQE